MIEKRKLKPATFAPDKEKLPVVTQFKPTAIDNALKDRIPDHLWSLVQEIGEHALNRLFEIVSSPTFYKYRGSDQTKLLMMAIERAYGKPDAPVRKSVNLNLSSSDNDAVNAALARLSDNVDLPEYTHTAQNARHRPKSSDYDLDPGSEQDGD